MTNPTDPNTVASALRDERDACVRALRKMRRRAKSGLTDAEKAEMLTIERRVAFIDAELEGLP